ncbi:MAG: Asp-tRNA(Asn)/Glu-tRNA(Gln) amidotransferase subunit GatC [Gemmatimonadota bacterium]|nr:Asp-tRNA(Asn)/Glu-tRNA(Gln) amidotransferase subunit GatC [Gemmatimonadota bacterium]
MAVSRDDVVHIASLARLALTEGHIPQLVAELNGILAHMDVLGAVDTGGVSLATGVGDAACPLRDDGGVQLPLLRSRDELAPMMRDGFFLVPRLDTHGDHEDEEP